MEKVLKYSGEKFRIRHYFDPDVKELAVDPNTGEVYKKQLGDTEGIEIYSPADELLGCFDYVDFENDKVIKKVIEQIY